MRDKTDANEETKAELNSGIEASNRVLTQANAAVNQELLNEAFEELLTRVDDWKNHRVDQFGDLLLYGQFPVVTGKSDVQKEVGLPSTFSIQCCCLLQAPDLNKPLPPVPTLLSRARSLFSRTEDSAMVYSGEHSCTELIGPASTSGDERNQSLDSFFADCSFYHRNLFHPLTGYPLAEALFMELCTNGSGIFCPQFEQYTIYLFERILLCCKEVNPNKSKDKLMGAQKDKKDKKDKNRKEPNKNAKLQLKGRIFMTNVTDVAALANKQGIS